LLYRFDWRYPGLHSGKLSAPWWSGLTDAGAMELMLRAYDVYRDPAYLRLADSLYASVTTRVADGGSLIYWDGEPWIEEYVQFGEAEERMPRVFNGMAYAANSVSEYEMFRHVKAPIAPALYRSLAHHISRFDLDGWSTYDAIGNAANPKYHRVNMTLADSLFAKTRLPQFKTYANRWEKSDRNAGLYWIVKSRWGAGQYVFLLAYMLLVISPLIAWSIASMGRKLDTSR
jgi:hypothetical protein